MLRTVLHFLFLVSFCNFILSCKSDQKNINSTEYYSIQGKTMGTYYSIKYSDAEGRNLKPQIDSILISINQSLSTYIPESYISQLNADPREKLSP